MFYLLFVYFYIQFTTFLFLGANDAQGNPRFTIDAVTGELKTFGRAPFMCESPEPPFKVGFY